MAEVEDRLVVRMEASLAKFEKQMARAVARRGQPFAAPFADIGVFGQTRHAFLEQWRQGTDVFGQPFVHHHVDGLKRDGTTDRVA